MRLKHTLKPALQLRKQVFRFTCSLAIVTLSCILAIFPSPGTTFSAALSAVAAETKKTPDFQTASTPIDEGLENKVFDEMSRFIRENYPKAKFTKTGAKIHFEYKTRPNLNTLTGKTETIPDFGGVIGDLDFKAGEYNGKVKLPQHYAEYAFYSVILAAPYVQSSNVHIYTRLAYPSDTPQSFTDAFEKLLKSFANGTPPSQLDDAAARNANASPQKADQNPEKTDGSLTSPNAVSSGERKLSFWKAVKGSSIVYVLPVIYFGKNRYFPLTGEIGKAFKISSQIAVDSYLGLPSDPFSIGCYGGDDRLSKHISKPTRKSLEDLAEWTGEPIEIYDIWKPYFLTTSLDSSLIRQIGFNILDLEKQVLKGTNKYGKRLIELEPALNRLNYFEGLSEADQDLCARLALYDVLDYNYQQRTLEDAWLSGDTGKSLEAAMSSTKNSPELVAAYNKLYQDCNEPLAVAVENAFKKAGPIFISLDLRRVLGEKGLLKLLQARGFQLTQVTGLMLTLEPGVVTELPYIEGDDTEAPPTSQK